jgi:signal transduction histidine kinase
MKKRKTHLINKKMQLNFMLKLLGITLLFSLFIGLQMYMTVWPVFSGFVPKDVTSLVSHQLFFRTSFFALPAVLLIVVFSVLVSHRIAGPLYNMERTIDLVIQGESVGYIRLREKDEFHNLAEKINELIGIIEKLRERGGKD